MPDTELPTVPPPDTREESIPPPLAETRLEKRAPAFGWRIVGGLGAGALLAACFPPIGLPFLLPLAIAALLALLPGLTPRQAFYVGLACGLTFFGITLCWLPRIFGVAAISLWAIAATFPALFCALFVWLRGRLPRVPVWLLAAVTWTAVEYFRSELMRPNFGWMGLGYAVVNIPTLAALASVFGSYGLTFVIVALGAIIGQWGEGEMGKWGDEKMRGGGKRERGQRFSFPHFLIAPLPLLLVWSVCFLLPRPLPTPSRPMNVRLVQADPENEEALFPLSEVLPSAKTDVIVWPEYSLVRDPMRIKNLHDRLAQVAITNHCYLLLGAKDEFDIKDQGGFRNTAFLFGPDGALAGKHVKNHTVHFFNDGVPGTEAKAIPTALGRLGVAICFDMDFPDVARRLTEDGAEVFLVPNNDPPKWGPIQPMQHRLMFQMRAVECGRWLARSDVAGGTSVAAPTGQEVERLHISGPTALDAAVGRETGKTLYVRGGWRFGQACLLLFGLLCCVNRKTRPAQ